MRRRLAFGGAGVVVVLGVTLGLTLTGGGSSGQKPGVVSTNAPLPDVTGTTIHGTAFSASEYRGRVLVLNFWNPYCQPCRQEATVLDLAEGALAPKEAVLAGVLFSNSNFPHDVPAARSFATELGERYPTLDDPHGTLASAFGIRGIPTTVVADPTGRIRYEVFGALKKGQLERLVSSLLPR